MKKIAIFITAAVLILFLTKIANNVPPPPPPGVAFSLKAQKIIQCTSTEITLVDRHNDPTHLEKDDSWPECSTFKANEWRDYYLSRGAKTKYLNSERSAWWRTVL